LGRKVSWLTFCFFWEKKISLMSSNFVTKYSYIGDHAWTKGNLKRKRPDIFKLVDNFVFGSLTTFFKDIYDLFKSSFKTFFYFLQFKMAVETEIKCTTTEKCTTVNFASSFVHHLTFYIYIEQFLVV
jgi:hypothetical protein